MNNAILTAKLLALVEGKETPESWLSWWSDHESELETLLSRGEFLRLKPCKHAFKWVPLLGSQKGAAGILEKSGTSFEISDLYQEQYERELNEFCQAQKQIQAERQKIFMPYQVNGELFKNAADDAVFMHCLPAYRGFEVTEEVIDGPQSVIFDEAENRLHAQKAVMATLMG